MESVTKVLIVAADVNVVTEVSSGLRKHGWKPVLASDAIMALTAARGEQPSMIVVKGQLPGGGGAAAIKRLRANVHTAAIPLIALAESAGLPQHKLEDAGAQKCMLEPVDVEALCREIGKHIGEPLTPSEAPKEVILDPARLSALQNTGLLDSNPDELLDDLTKLAARLVNVPTALLSLVDKDRQFFKSQVGLGEPHATSRQTPLSHSFCQWVVSGNEHLAVSDARKHPILNRNLAVRDLGVIAYAGTPLSSEMGQPIGAFCAIDSKPHSWSEADIETLRDLSEIVAAHVAITGPRQHRGSGTAGAVRMHMLAESIRAATRVLRRPDFVLQDREQKHMIAVLDLHSEHLSRLIAEIVPLSQEAAMDWDAAA